MNDVDHTKTEEPPVRKSIQVDLPVAEAFELFTEGIGSWWPLKTHSVGGEQALTCKLEGKAGGRLYEIQEGGQEVQWGTLLVWEPPRRLVMTWHPGYESELAQEVEVTFKAEGAGARLELVHRGWERREAPQEARDGYERGWDLVLGRYLAQVPLAATHDEAGTA